MSVVIVTPKLANSQKGMLMSFFSQAAPAQDHDWVEPSGFVRITVDLHLHWKHLELTSEAAQEPWPEQELVEFSQADFEAKHVGILDGRFLAIEARRG